MSEVFTNTAKARLKKGEKLTAAWVQLGSPIAAEIMAQAGYDMLVVDCEHAPIDPSTLFPILQAVNGYETTAIARAPCWTAAQRAFMCRMLIRRKKQ